MWVTATHTESTFATAACFGAFQVSFVHEGDFVIIITTAGEERCLITVHSSAGWYIVISGTLCVGCVVYYYEWVFD